MNKKLISVLGIVSVQNTSSVFKCTKYDAFKVFKENRYCGFKEQEAYTSEEEKKDWRKHIDELKESMCNFGRRLGGSEPMFDDREPIIVFKIGNVFYIVDGQHRFVAAMELGIPFYVRIVTSELVDAKGVNLATTYDYAKDYFFRLNNSNCRSGGSKKWSHYNNISTCAREGNKVAIFISDFCKDNPLFNERTLNTKAVSEKIKNKNYTACQMSENNMKGNQQLIDGIKEFAAMAQKLAEDSYFGYKFRNDKSKFNAIKKLINTDRFSTAVRYVLDHKTPINVLETNCRYNKTGKIVGASSPSAYYSMWGISK